MKKIWKTILLLLCLLCLSGCDKKADSNSNEKKDEEKAAQTEEIKIIHDSDVALADQTSSAEAAPVPEKKNILIALDPGHQGPGADTSALEPNAPGSDILKAKVAGGTSGSFSGIPEYQLNLDIAWMVHDRLISQGYDVLMTRENHDTAISNVERAVLANEAGADISVRIHANGSEDPGVNGALVLIGSPENPYVANEYDSSYRLGESILTAYCNATGIQNLGIQFNDTMTGINWSQIPVIILEMGFMTNQQDDLNMADAACREKMADGIVAGINAYYGF